MADAPLDLDSVPLFPLPNVVLFPRAVLPLHIFEQRYRQMTADALASDALIAMALLREGWQQTYHGRPAVHAVVCVGRVIAHNQLPDGRYNLLLQGLQRARVMEEDFALAYRRARLERVAEASVFDLDLESARERVALVVQRSKLARTTLGQELVKILRSPIATADLLDVFAFSVLDDVCVKQSLLEETDVRVRAARTVKAIEQLYPAEPVEVEWMRQCLN